MNNLNENSIEQFIINILKSLGWDYAFGPEIAPEGAHQERNSLEDVLLIDRLKNAIRRINYPINESEINDVIKQLKHLNFPDLVANNEKFHRMLTEGIKISYRKDGEERGRIVWLIDFEHPENNDFLAVNQFTVVENEVNKRPDIVLFVNGLPLVVFELKNPADEKATIQSAYRQIQTYKTTIPSLFDYNEIIVLSDGLDTRAGSLSAEFDRFMAWKSLDGKTNTPPYMSGAELLVRGMLNMETLLDFVQHFIVFDKSKEMDKKTWQITIRTVKKIAAYHQYYAVNKAVESTLRAVGINREADRVKSEPALYGLKSVKEQAYGDRKAGVIWHTQGSGKSLSMVFFTGKIVLKLNNPTILVITDRNDLDDQLFDTFASCKQILRQTPVQANSREKLKELLSVRSGGIVFSTIQKFYPENGNRYEELSDRKNIIVIADEAHRTQYGFKGRVDGKTGEIKYGFAKYIRDALPNATFIGFTGTPIEKEDRNTPAVFGNYIDVYDMAQAVKDKMTVPIYYESRLAKVYLSDEGKKLVAELDKELNGSGLSEDQKNNLKWKQLESIVGSKDRIKRIAEDIVNHFEKRQEVFEGKGMIVTMSRRIAVDLYEEIVKLRPKWHSNDLRKGVIKVVITSASSDGPKMAKHHTSKDHRRVLSERMKNPDDPLKLVIVCDMWLTGFDVPCLHTMYIDKPMKGHTLVQAIARVNRVYKDKPGGLIVDYIGIASDLKEALFVYSKSGERENPIIAQKEAIKVMMEKFEIVKQMYYGFPYERYFTADTSKKLSIILEAEDFILKLENGKKRYLDNVTALSKAFALAMPSEESMAIKDDVAFFQAVKSRLTKFDRSGNGKTNEEMETAIKQVIDQALVTDKVIDIFDAAGIKKPDISVLSDEFLLEVKNMKHKNIALEVLNRLLNNEIRSRRKTNLVQSKTLMEMLEESVKKYQNKVLTAAEVIEELIELAKEIKKMDKEPEELGLSKYEYGFYTAVAKNESARELMGKEKLRELAVVLYQKVKNNASIDWTIKESARAKLRVIVKRTLRKYGYPPDMRKLATETVLKQAEQIADELVK